MLVEASCVGLLYVRRDDERGVRLPCCMPLCEAKCYLVLFEPVPGMTDDPAAGDFDRRGDDALVFLVRQARRLAGRADGADAVGAGGDLKFDLLLEERVIRPRHP